MTIATDCVGTCGVCLRRHHNVGYSPTDKHPVLWVCDDCLTAVPEAALVKKVYHMPQRKLDAYEDMALEQAGEVGGAYLDQIGQTDLAALEPHQFREFLRQVLTGYADSMRDMIKEGEAPF